MSDIAVTRKFAELIAAPKVGSSSAARVEAIRTLTNYVGCAIGGAQHDTVERAVRGLCLSHEGPAFLFGRPERMDPFHAALVNGIASNVYGFDDTHLETMIHPAGPVASALFAFCDLRSTTGRAFLDALLIGVEVECRIGLAAGAAHSKLGWHVTGTAGTFGAAAAVGVLAGLDPERMTHALGLAASQPVGLRRNFGSMTVSFHVGRAAQNGLTASLLAEQGFTASSDSLEGDSGWARVLSPGFDSSFLLRPFDPPYEIERNTYKPYASGIVTHPAMEAAINLARRHMIAPSDILEIQILGNPLVRDLTGNMRPKTKLESKVSIAHAVAAAVAEQSGGPNQFSDRALHDPVIAALRERVRLAVDESVARDEATVSIRLASGEIVKEHIRHAVGSLDRPMTDQDVSDKFRSLTDRLLSPEQQARTLSLCGQLDDLPDVSQITRSAATRKQMVS